MKDSNLLAWMRNDSTSIRVRHIRIAIASHNDLPVDRVYTLDRSSQVCCAVVQGNASERLVRRNINGRNSCILLHEQHTRNTWDRPLKRRMIVVAERLIASTCRRGDRTRSHKLVGVAIKISKIPSIGIDSADYLMLVPGAVCCDYHRT